MRRAVRRFARVQFHAAAQPALALSVVGLLFLSTTGSRLAVQCTLLRTTLYCLAAKVLAASLRFPKSKPALITVRMLQGAKPSTFGAAAGRMGAEKKNQQKPGRSPFSCRQNRGMEHPLHLGATLPQSQNPEFPLLLGYPKTRARGLAVFWTLSAEPKHITPYYRRNLQMAIMASIIATLQAAP